MKKAFLLLTALLLLGPAARAIPPATDDQLLRDFLWEEFITLPKEERPKVGLALSAGGVRGFAHVGVLETLQNAGVPVDMLSGTSMGSVVGSLYAAGLSTDKLWDISQHMTLANITPDFNFMGLLRVLLQKKLPSSSNLQQFFREQIGEMRFEDLEIPFSTAAMDVKTGERVVFDSGPLAIAVRASMNMPGVFEPVQYRHRYLVDGAVVDYLPTGSVRDMGAEYVIASVTPPDFYSDLPQSVASYLLRTGDVRGAAMIEESAKKANFVFMNRVINIGTLDVDKLHSAGEVGIREAHRKLGDLQEDLVLYSIYDILKK